MSKLLLFAELSERGVRHSRRHIDRLEAAGKFPRRVPIGDNRVGWVAAEIDDHINRAIASRNTEAGTLGSDLESTTPAT